MPPRRDRIPQDVPDVTSGGRLLCYAAAGQIEHLLRLRKDLTQGKIAQGAGFGGNTENANSNLSSALRKGLTDQQLQRLDEIIGALAPDLDDTGGLSSLALRHATEQHGRTRGGGSFTAHVPPSWTSRILKDPPVDDIGVLIQASALLSAFQAAGKMDRNGTSVERVRTRYREEIDLLVRRLILVSVAPPTSRNYDAQIMLGSLASYAFETMRERLESELRWSPLGFRVWRAITKLVKLNADSEQTEELRVWVRELISDSEELRERSLYAGRSLDLELAITVPASWSPPGDDWVGAALLRRARNPDATIRERGTAAMGLWERAFAENRPDREQTETALRDLIAEFRDPQTRPDAAAGLRWVAATLEHVIKEQTTVCNQWPDPGEDWFGNVRRAASELDHSDIPEHLLSGTKSLFLHMILQNAGVYRRQAIETVVTSGWNLPVAKALGSLLENEKTEAWLRIRAEFALGFLQRPDPRVAADLTHACLHAFRNLELEAFPDKEPQRSCLTEMHASLFAVGDLFGAEGAGDRHHVRERLRPVLTALASMEGRQAELLQRAARAAAYVLTVTAQPRQGGRPDLSEELLEKLSTYPDEVTARLSRWARSFRFASDGKIRPLLAAAEYANHDDDTGFY